MWIRSLVFVALVIVAVGCSRQVGTPRPAQSTPQAPGAVSAAPVAPDRRVGALFLGGETLHTCSGSVLDSAAGDLILTAAHCVADGVDAYFVPGFSGEVQRDDAWHVDEVFLDPRWLANQDPLADFAIGRVSRDGGGSVRDAAGGGYTLGRAPAVGADVAVTGYPTGVGGGPIGCRTTIAAHDETFPSLRCAGLVDGTSGSPWVSGSTVAGITGGLDGGGCHDDVSYSPPFDDAVARLLARAQAGGEADRAPDAFGDDC
jgi:hypothetical protein